MSTTTKGSLKPCSRTDPRYGRIKKVFMAYIHNPDPYEQYIPPYTRDQLRNPAIYRQALREKAEHSTHQLDKIQLHKATVRRLIESLVSCGVAVSHDQIHEEEHVTNLLKYYEDQIIDSDAVLLIITKSLNYYMSNEAPMDENEILLTRHFLHNLMTIKKPSGTCFIPVFINRPVDRSSIPTTLASSNCYSVCEPFDVCSGGLSDLYAYLTNQNTLELPSSSEVIAIPQRRTACKFEWLQILLMHQRIFDKNGRNDFRIIFEKTWIIIIVHDFSLGLLWLIGGT